MRIVTGGVLFPKLVSRLGSVVEKVGASPTAAPKAASVLHSAFGTLRWARAISTHHVVEIEYGGIILQGCMEGAVPPFLFLGRP